MVALADRYMVPWTEWAYCTCGDPTGAADEGMVLNPGKPKTRSNLRMTIVHSLVEPYPQALAGTPMSWRFDRSNETFRLSYRTARASGKSRFPAGSISKIAVPRRIFSHGYSVNVQGGAIISRVRSGPLRIASCRRVKLIKITIRAGGKSHQSCWR